MTWITNLVHPFLYLSAYMHAYFWKFYVLLRVINLSCWGQPICEHKSSKSVYDSNLFRIEHNFLFVAGPLWKWPKWTPKYQLQTKQVSWWVFMTLSWVYLWRIFIWFLKSSPSSCHSYFSYLSFLYYSSRSHQSMPCSLVLSWMCFPSSTRALRSSGN